MRLATEMLEWYKNNRKVRRFKITDSMYMKYFKEIENNLDYDEEVYIAFIGSIGEQGSFFHSIPCFFGELCGVAITNKGIIVSKSNGVIFPIKSILTVQLNYTQVFTFIGGVVIVLGVVLVLLKGYLNKYMHIDKLEEEAKAIADAEEKEAEVA